MLILLRCPRHLKFATPSECEKLSGGDLRESRESPRIIHHGKHDLEQNLGFLRLSWEVIHPVIHYRIDSIIFIRKIFFPGPSPTLFAQESVSSCHVL